MRPMHIRLGMATIALLTLASAAVASVAPIRVGIFTGIGQGRLGGTAYHTAANAIISILAAPDTAGIGPDLVIHPAGVVTTRFGLVSGTGTPTTAQRQAFIDALDTTDVAIFVTNVDIGNIMSNPDHRARLEAFSRTKGVISLTQTLDTYGSWPAWDSLQGTRFQNFPASARNATIHLDTLDRQDASWRFLNKGLPDTARFLENWFSFITNGNVIRAVPGLKVSVRVDESSYENGLGGARAMGEDHPVSWYRELPEGGRFFYTSIGYRAQTFLNNGGNPSTPFLRRQLYNAILWAAGYNNDGTGIKQDVRGADALASRFADHAHLSLSGGTLTVSLLHNGAHTIEVTSLDGRRIDSRRGAGRGEHSFTNLRPGAVYVVAVTTGAGRFTRLAAIQ